MEVLNPICSLLSESESVSLRSIGCAPGAKCGGVPAILLQMDEQPLDEGDAATLHYKTLGHLHGT